MHVNVQKILLQFMETCQLNRQFDWLNALSADNRLRTHPRQVSNSINHLDQYSYRGQEGWRADETVNVVMEFEYMGAVLSQTVG